MRYLKYTSLAITLAFFTAVGHCAEKFDVGAIPPDFIGKTKDGDRINISDHKGKLVVVTFWASWCPPCRKELPILENIQKQLGNDVIKVVAINWKEERKLYRNTVRRLKGSVLTYTHDKYGRIGDAFGVDGIPHLVIVGPDGKIVHVGSGYGDGTAEELVHIINDQLTQMSQPNA